MGNKDMGFIKLYRSILNHPLWLEKPFDRARAWIDLLLIAQFKAGFFYKRGVKVDYKRSAVTRGVQGLSERWGWSEGKVKRFLNGLENEQQITQQKSNLITSISISNYELYQKTESKRGSKRRIDEGKTETNKECKECKKKVYPTFYLDEWHSCEHNKEYENFIEMLLGSNSKQTALSSVLELEEQCTYNQFVIAYNKANDYGFSLQDYLVSMDNWPRLSKNNKSLQSTLLNWMNKDFKNKNK